MRQKLCRNRVIITKNISIVIIIHVYDEIPKNVYIYIYTHTYIYIYYISLKSQESKKVSLAGWPIRNSHSYRCDFGQQNFEENVFDYIQKKVISLLIQQAAPPPFPFLSHLRKSQLYIWISNGKIDLSNLVSVIPITADRCAQLYNRFHQFSEGNY